MSLIQQLNLEVFQEQERVTVVKIIKSVIEWNNIYYTEIKGKKTLGFVPTMGALHKGHMSLIKRSVLENDITICSIFVNHTQFNDANDLQNYPVSLEADIDLLDNEGCNYVFIPNREMIYPDNYKYKISENDLSTKFCGAHREGHFDGVLTVVIKLLNIIKCENAYFGEKDWQQYYLIKGMVEALFIPCNIISCTLIREDDGLAYSSRNKLLTPMDRLKAPNLYRIINTEKPLETMKEELIDLGFVVDYLEIMDGRLLVAASLGKVRLIDNVKR